MYFNYYMKESKVSSMKFDIPCGQGRLQITDDGYLQQVNAWKRVAWSVPARTVGGVSSRRHGLALHVTVETPSGHHTVTTVTNQNYERLRAALEIGRAHV